MSILEHCTEGHAVPAFNIYIPFSTDKVPTLKHCFLKRIEIDTKNPPAVIKASDGHVYTAVYDSRLPSTEKANVIISFQAHTYGNFAIIRSINRNLRD